MDKKTAELRTTLRVASALVLALGLGFAAVIWATADEAAPGAMDEILLSKQYTREIQRFGGRQAVLFDEFNRWFASLWHGRRLGMTVAFLSALGAGALYFVSRRVDGHDPER